MITALILFTLFVVVLLAIDLGVFHRHAHVVSVREALGWSACWLSLGLAFAVVVYFGYEYQVWGLGTRIDPVDNAPIDGATAVEKYLTGYLVEKSLSIDNIFVMSMIFAGLAVPGVYQHRVLFWGVLGAVAMLGLRSLYFALAGIVDKFRYLKPAMAIVLLLVGGKMLAAEWLKEMLGSHFNLYLLAAVASVIASGILLSLAADRWEQTRADETATAIPRLVPLWLPRNDPPT